MIDHSQNDHATEDELVALDRVLDTLARRDGADVWDSPSWDTENSTRCDAGLAALSSFAHAIDRRAEGLTAAARAIDPSMAHPSAARPREASSSPRDTAPRNRRPATPRHAAHPGRRRRRLLALPLLLCIALAIVGPISASPDAPLHDVHRWLFQQGQESPDDSARMLLANARQALDRATTTSGPARSAELDDARRNINEARTVLLRITDDTTRQQLDEHLDSLEQRANELGTSNQEDSTPGTDNQENQSGRRGENGGGGHTGGQGVVAND